VHDVIAILCNENELHDLQKSFVYSVLDISQWFL